MNALATVLLVLSSSSAFAANYELSPACARMEGRHEVQYRGQSLPFWPSILELSVTFPRDALGLTYNTNYGPVNVDATLDTEAMLKSVTEKLIITNPMVFDCNATPETCLDQDALRTFVNARRSVIRSADARVNEVLDCAIERIRLFNKKVRAEVLQPRIAR